MWVMIGGGTVLVTIIVHITLLSEYVGLLRLPAAAKDCAAPTTPQDIPACIFTNPDEIVFNHGMMHP